MLRYSRADEPQKERFLELMENTLKSLPEEEKKHYRIIEKSKSLFIEQINQIKQTNSKGSPLNFTEKNLQTKIEELYAKGLFEYHTHHIIPGFNSPSSSEHFSPEFFPRESNRSIIIEIERINIEVMNTLTRSKNEKQPIKK